MRELPRDAVAPFLVREAHEELAIDPGLVRIVGNTDSFVTGSGFTLTPVLGLVPPDISIVPDPREVASWFEAPLRFVLDQANHDGRLFRIITPRTAADRGCSFPCSPTNAAAPCSIS